MPATPESSVDRVKSAISQMRADLTKPSQTDFSTRNLVIDKIILELEKDDIAVRVHNTPIGPLDYLKHDGNVIDILKIPEMNGYFRRQNRTVAFPPTPAEFFDQVRKAPRYAFSQFGFTRQEVEGTSTFFKDATSLLEGQTPLMWLFADLSDIWRSSINLVLDPNKANTDARRSFKNTPAGEPFYLKKATLEGNSLAALLRAYLDPETLISFVEILEPQDQFILGAVEKLPDSLENAIAELSVLKRIQQ